MTLFEQKSEAGSWVAINPLLTVRANSTATLLANGQVLVSGGLSGGSYLASTELFDPVGETWTNTGSMLLGRQLHTATLLTNGQVLVTGGVDNNGSATTQTELYNPMTRAWKISGAMHVARYAHTATRLTNGLVLVVGGTTGVLGNGTPESTAEIYNPITELWTTTGSLKTPRARQAATLLPNGKVFVTGGASSFNITTNSAELFNPVAGTWTSAGTMSVERASHTATLLTNGQVLISGGFPTSNNIVDLYNPANGVWARTGDMNLPRYGHSATLLTNGLVLIAAGAPRGSPLTTSAELYNPVNGVWTLANSLGLPRYFHTATLLSNGRCLVVGGVGGNGSVELYNPSDQDVPTFNLEKVLKTSNNTLWFSFTNLPDVGFLVFATTNLALPLGNWTEIGRPMQISPGQYQFNDSTATNGRGRFYTVRSQ